jgi:hypothetical protein
VGIKLVIEQALRAGASHAVAIIDDVNLACSDPDTILPSVHALREAAQERGLQLNFAKCKLLWPRPDPIPEPLQLFCDRNNVVVLRDAFATTILGCPIGTDVEGIGRLALNTVRQHEPFFEALTHPEMPTSIASRLLQYSGLPRMNYLTRTGYASQLNPAYVAFDRMVAETDSRICETDILTPPQQAQRNMPFRNSGMGLSPYTEVCHFALVGAMSRRPRVCLPFAHKAFLSQ